jgi:biotin operon repressor
VEFTNKETDITSLNLEQEMFIYSLNRLEKVFDWRIINELIDEAKDYTLNKTFAEKEDIIKRLADISVKAKEQSEISLKLIDRINQIVAYKPIDTVLLSERVMKAKTYFIEKFHEDILKPIENIREELKKKKRTKQLINFFRGLETDLWRKISEIEKASIAGLDLKIKVSYKEHFKKDSSPKEIEEKSKIPGESNNEEYQKEKAYSVEDIRKHKPNAFRPWTKEDDEKLLELSSNNTSVFEIAKVFERSRNAIELRIEKIKTEGISETKVKGDSKKTSLDLYKDKKTIEEIATSRGMTVSTIEGHLELYIVSGEVNLFDFITEEQFQAIKAGVDKVGIENLSELKRFVGDSIPWGRLRMAVNYLIKNKYNL